MKTESDKDNMNTIKAEVKAYYFDTCKPEEATAYQSLKDALRARGLKCFETWGGGVGHYAVGQKHGGQVEIETTHLFNNQFNTTNARLHDWAQDYPINFSDRIKKGHYLVSGPGADKLSELRRNTSACGYCGKQEPAAKGYVFCPHCLDSDYLTLETLHLTRMQPVASSKDRAPLTDAEAANLVPQFLQAKLHGSTERGKARIAKERAAIESDYIKTVAKATEERDAKRWIIDHAPGLMANHIFYSHTGKHCFGWRTPLSAAEVSQLLDILLASSHSVARLNAPTGRR